MFGKSQLSTQLIRECISSNVAIGYYSDDGHYFGKTSSFERIDPVRQKRQIYLTDDPLFCLEWSRRIVSAKIRNSITLLKENGEIYLFSPKEMQGLRHSLDHLSETDDVNTIIGFEGNAAKCYFKCLAKLVRDDAFSFSGRSSRPPKDPFNSMLSFGYSLFYRNIIGAIERHGLHPYFAYMHKMKFGHAALASDLVEEYRAPLVDKTVLDLVNSGEIDSSGFYKNEAGAIFMRKDVVRRLTNEFSEVIAKNRRYFLSLEDGKAYGFQAMLDKKLNTLVRAIEHRDPYIYEPYIWDPKAS